jgi:beta-lactamase superfamily II metal-dependent hydrolase
VYGNVETATFLTHAGLLARDENTDAKIKAELDYILEPINKVLGKDYPLSHDWSTMHLFEKIPAMIVEGGSILKTRDHGVGNYVVAIDMTLDEDYKNYLALLEKLGFEKVYDNGEKGINDTVYTSTYKLDDLYVTVTHISYDFQTFISACYDVNLSEHLEDKFSDDVIEGKSTKVHMLQIHNPGGNSIVIELKNGHFIVSDGGTDTEFDYLMRYLLSLVPEGEKPIIDAWIVTHLHNDHFHVVNGFNKNPEMADKLYVEGIYFHEPSDEVKDMDPGVYNEIANEYKAISLMKTTKGETPKIYRPQTGQRYYFSDIYFEILMAPEQVWPEEHTNSFNDSSVFYLFNIEGQTFLNAGDGYKSNMEFLMTAYDKEYLHFDLFQVLHHGHNTWDEFTDYCSFGTLLFCSPVVDKFFVGMSGPNGHLIDVADDFYVSHSNSTVFTFPYKLGSAQYVPMP